MKKKIIELENVKIQKIKNRAHYILIPKPFLDYGPLDTDTEYCIVIYKEVDENE